MKSLSLLFLLLFQCVGGRADDAGSGHPQVYFENQAIDRLAFRFRVFGIDHPDTHLTNWSQLFAQEQPDILYRFQASYESFGSDRGFENSILEKYVLMPPGVIADDQLGGEVVLAGARTFPGPDGLPLRAIVARLPDRFRGFTKADVFFRRWVAKAGVEIPKPVPMPPIPRPVKSRADMTAEEWDRENRHWIDPILRAALASNATALQANPKAHAGPFESKADRMLTESAQPKPLPDSGWRDPRWGLLAVGGVISMLFGGIWISRRR
jgi:hypothetical protein